MELFLLGAGLSWTMSKILPFIVLLLFGVILCVVIRKRSSKKWLRLSSYLLILVPAAIYFALHPIYEGDFSNEYRTEKLADDYKELENGSLTVITIPNCPFCAESIEGMTTIADRIVADKKINFVVCSDDPATLEDYEKISDGQLNVKLAQNIEAMAELAESRFPAFVFTDEAGNMKIWPNEGFGVLAKDWIEGQLEID